MYLMLAFKYPSGASGEAAQEAAMSPLKNIQKLQYFCGFFRYLPCMEDFYRRFGTLKIPLGDRRGAFDKLNIQNHTPPPQKLSVSFFSALTCMLKINFQLIFYFCKKLRPSFAGKIGLFGIHLVKPLKNIMKSADFQCFQQLMGLILISFSFPLELLEDFELDPTP